MDNTPFTIREAVAGVRSRKALVVFLFLGIMLSVGAVTLLSTKQYTSQAKIFVRLGRENVGLDPTATLGEGTIITTPMSREAEITSVVHMIRSRELYEEVVDHFGYETILKGVLPEEPTEGEGSDFSVVDKIKSSLVSLGVMNDISPREAAIIQLTKKISVEILDYSNVISVSYEAKSPKLAQSVVQWLVSRYEESHVKIHRSEGALDFMQQKAEEFKKLLHQKEQQLEEFKIQSGMVSSDLLKQELVSSIAKIKSQLRDVTVEHDALESEVKALNRALASLSPKSVVAETKGAGNQGADGMRQLLYEQELQLAEMSAKHTSVHPIVKRLQSAVDMSKEILAKVEEQRTESVMGANPVYAEIKIEMLKKEPLLLAAKKKCETLAADLSKEQGLLEKFSRDEREYRRLTRELDLEDSNYRRYVRNLAQVAVDQSLEKNRMSNISIAQPASFSEKPSRPNKLVNLIVGLALASMGSVGTAVLLAYFKDTSEQPASQSATHYETAPNHRVRVSEPQATAEL